MTRLALWQDVRHAIRLIARHRGTALLAIVCLSLGIGIVATMFASADPWLFRPLPYAGPDRLVTLREVSPRGRTTLLSAPLVADCRGETGVLAATGALTRTAYNLSTAEEPERVAGAVLACAGVYGVTARAVARRRQEIGIRMALGADAPQIVRLVLRGGLRLARGCVVAGTLGALALTRLLSGLLYGVSPSDPLVLAASALSLFAVAIAATYVPARLATRIDPGETLRSESQANKSPARTEEAD